MQLIFSEFIKCLKNKRGVIVNKNGILRNYIKRRYNYWKRNINCLKDISTSCNDDIKLIYSEIDEIYNEILCYRFDDKTIKKPYVLFDGYIPLSFNGDWLGKVITKNDVIYRGIFANSKLDFIELWRKGIIQVLARRGYFPKTTITEYYCDLFPIILEHETMNFSTSKSWSYEMIRDASITLCKIRGVLMKFGYTLHDAHLNNLTFTKGRFVFTDLGSIKKNNSDEWDGFPKELVFAALYKMLFLNLSNSLIKRDQIFDEYNNAIWFTDRYYDDSTIECYQALKIFKRHLFLSGQWGRLLKAIGLFDFYLVTPINILGVFPSRTVRLKNNYSVNKSIVLYMISQIQEEIESICDVGSYSENVTYELNHDDFRIVMIIDNDDEADALYQQCKRECLKIDLLMRNIMYGCDEITDKYCKSDLAIVTNFVEKTKGFHYHSFDSSLYALRKLCRKYAIISCQKETVVEMENCINTYFIRKKAVVDYDMVYCLLEVR